MTSRQCSNSYSDFFSGLTYLNIMYRASTREPILGSCPLYQPQLLSDAESSSVSTLLYVVGASNMSSDTLSPSWQTCLLSLPTSRACECHHARVLFLRSLFLILIRTAPLVRVTHPDFAIIDAHSFSPLASRSSLELVPIWGSHGPVL